MQSVRSGKAKAARRVVEVLEYFDENNREATVMDIVRRYNRPQSSTSELLSSLVDMGLLYKNPSSRTYRLTPRAAILGSLSQPSAIRDGRLLKLIDRLSAQTGLSIALFGLVGLNTQVFLWKEGRKCLPTKPGRMNVGSFDPLCSSAAGQLLLSTVAGNRRDGLVRRLNSEAAEDAKFNCGDMLKRIETLEQEKAATGVCGFECNAESTSVLLPIDASDAPLVLSFVYQPSVEIDASALTNLLRQAVEECLEQGGAERRELATLSVAR